MNNFELLVLLIISLIIVFCVLKKRNQASNENFWHGRRWWGWGPWGPRRWWYTNPYYYW